jgi:hypothetical protein
VDVTYRSIRIATQTEFFVAVSSRILKRPVLKLFKIVG